MHNKHLHDQFGRYTIFLLLFLGAGFVSGSVVHFGEGVTVWDIAILMLGIVLFVTGSVLQTAGEERGPHHLTHVIISSLFLSLTVGMASGGTQHFIDTPVYSAWLIPLGVTIGFLAFLLKQRMSMPLRHWLLLIVLLCITGVALHVGLLMLNASLPESLRAGHGSHGEIHSTTPTLLPSSTQNNDDHH